ncbi:helix-turn-helix domain-containing protein [Eudoraea chungangensis]|uniref:helix-turn-helix domain-containing protein n=1 Tax=Eudoraea chungangensis TaxID=1481905 RepID=UPI0023EE15FF|nr:helix-turn-helix domain-containing protein [Eudoraea chungangensis]
MRNIQHQPDPNEKSSTGASLVEKLSTEIDKNLHNDQFGVDSLAKAVGMSRSSLHRKLQKETGLSSSQFIRQYRLKKAIHILRTEDITASETAYRVGFSSATYFSTCFHKYFGYPPGEVKSHLDEQQPPHHIFKKLPKFRKAVNLRFFLLFIVFTILFVAFAIWRAYDDEENLSTINSIKNESTNKSIVVLPIKNYTGDPSLEYVSDGMTDAVISRLTEVSAMDKVIPFTSSLVYKNTAKTVEDIAEELGVDNLLQGSLQKSGEEIRINLQLVNVNENDHMWSKEFTFIWKADEIFRIQSQVVEGIAQEMKASISKEELKSIQKISTKSKQAYSYYMQAGFQKNKANGEAYKSAIELYERAIAIDSVFLEPYLGIANIWTNGGLVWGLYKEQEAWQNAKYYIQKALEIDPNSKEIKDELYTGYFYFDWDFEKVEEHYKERKRNPFFDSTPGIEADYAIKTGRYQDAIDIMNEYILIDPSVGVFFFFKAEALMYSGKIEEAKQLMEKSDRLYSDNWFYLRESAKIHYYLNQFDQSRVQLGKLLNRFPDYPPILMWLNAVYAQQDRNYEKVNKHLAELKAEYKKGSSGSPAWFLAMYYCTIQDYDLAFIWLEKSYQLHEVEMTWLREEPLLADVRSDIRYQDLHEKVGFNFVKNPRTSLTTK